MASILSKLELGYIERLTRQELFREIRDHAADLPADLRESLEHQSLNRLQLVLLVARLVHSLRYLQSRG
jgi:hypothetical protein